MADEILWLVFPLCLAWFIQKIFHDVFHPLLSEREVTTDEKTELNPYFNLGYAACPLKKQKEAYLKVLYSIGFILYALIALPKLWIDNPVDNVLDGEIKFSALWKCFALILSALYLDELIWNEADWYALVFHHLTAILAIFIIVTESTSLPAGLVFIRASSIPFQDVGFNIAGVLFRLNLVKDHVFWQKLKAYHYTVANLIVVIIEWIYLINIRHKANFLVYMCVISWQLTEIWAIHIVFDFAKNVPEILKKKIERETNYMAELDKDKEAPCGGESLEFDAVPDAHCELAVST